MVDSTNLYTTTYLVDQLAILVESIADEKSRQSLGNSKQIKANKFVEECLKFYKRITESDMSEKMQIDKLLKFYVYMRKFLTIVEMHESLNEYYKTIDALVQKLGDTIIHLKNTLAKKVSESKTEMENFILSLILKDKSCTFSSYCDYEHHETTFNEMWNKAKTSILKILLLYGSKGNGKKMISKCLAEKNKCSFLDLNCSDLFDKINNFPVYLSHSLINRGPAIIFIPDIEKYNEFKDKLAFFFDKIIECKTNHFLIIGTSSNPSIINKDIQKRFAWKNYIGPVSWKYKSAYIQNLLSGRKYEITNDQFQDLTKKMIKYSNKDIIQIIMKTISKMKQKEQNIIKYEDILQSMTYFPETITIEALKEYKNFKES